MTDFYKAFPQFHVGVDCIIFGYSKGELSILLTKRRFEPGMGQWSLMGGFVSDDESVDSAAKRVLFELTGLRDVYMEQVGAFGEVGRDSGQRVISVAYYALIAFDELDRLRLREHNAHWTPIDQMPPLLFDHAQMVEKARDMLRTKVATQPIGFNLLPKTFTLTQLQSLYEAILGEKIDKRNFRKRITDMDCIEKTDLIDKTGSRRGAALFKFNDHTYRRDQKFKLL